MFLEDPLIWSLKLQPLECRWKSQDGMELHAVLAALVENVVVVSSMIVDGSRIVVEALVVDESRVVVVLPSFVVASVVVEILVALT